MSDLSTRVRLRREQLGLSQEELARRSRPALAAAPFPCSVEECRRLMREIDDLYAGKRNDLEHLKDRLVEVTFNVTHTCSESIGFRSLRAARVPGCIRPSTSAFSQCCARGFQCAGPDSMRASIPAGTFWAS